METVNSIITTHKRTWIGTLAGGTAGYFACKKIIKSDKWWAIGLSVVVGAAVGSVIQDKVTKTSVTITK